MKYYIFIDWKYLNKDWVQTYFENVPQIIESYAGKVLFSTDNVDKLFGDRETNDHYVLLEFPSKDAFLKYYNSEEYAPFKKARDEGTTHIEAVGIMGEIRR